MIRHNPGSSHGLCSFVAGTVLTPPQGITSVNIISSGSTCSSNNASIQVSVFGGTSPYLYTLIYPNGNTTNVTNNLSTQIFSSLESGTYSVVVQDASGCSYLEETTLFATNAYTISTQVTGTTCNENNGIVLVTRTEGGVYPYDYSLDGIQNIIDTTSSAVTFTNVSSGQHTVYVTDAAGCVQTSQVYVIPSEPLDFTLYSTSCGEGSDGTITALISSGTPPFTFQWSNNVQSNPQQIQITGLTAGTYSLTVVDSVGCSLNRTTSVDCQGIYVSYQTYIMGGEEFSIQTQSKYGIAQMLNEGFNDLTFDKVDCSLLSAVFGVKVSVNPLGLTTSQNFFTGTTLVSVPSDNLYYDTVKNLLLTVPGVGIVTIDALNNQITISTSQNNTILNGQEIIVELTIVYDIMCLSCELPTPTPSITPTLTLTPTNTTTPTITPTITNTPIISVTPTTTSTPTPTITPTITNTASNTPIINVTPTATNTPTITPTISPTNTPTLTQTPTITNTSTITPTITKTPTRTPTPTPPAYCGFLYFVENTGGLCTDPVTYTDCYEVPQSVPAPLPGQSFEVCANFLGQPVCACPNVVITVVTFCSACPYPTNLIAQLTSNGSTSLFVYTVSPMLFNSKLQWVSSGGGTIRYDGVKWVIFGYNPNGIVYFNSIDASSVVPGNSNWTYSGGTGVRNIVMTWNGCGRP